MFSFHLGRRFPAVLLCLAWLTHLPEILALMGDSHCINQHKYCVNATVEDGIATYQLTAMKEAPEDVGWMALGFGEGMLRSPLVILWRAPDGSMTVSHRYAVWYQEPAILKMPPRVATPIEPKLSAWHPTKSTTYSFTMPINRTEFAASSGVEHLVWAISPSRPPSGDPNSHIPRHMDVGYLKLDLSKEIQEPMMKPEGTSTPSTTQTLPSPPSSPKAPSSKTSHRPNPPSKHSKTVLAHGILLTFGFLVVLPIGVLTGRWGRTFTPIWFKVHWILNWSVALPAIALGWCLGPIAVNQHDGPHFSDPHKMWGTVLVSIYLVQIFLGRHIHQRRLEQTLPIKNNHPPLNITHVVVGLLILVFAFLQVRTGLEKLIHSPDYSNVAFWGLRLWKFWVVAVPFLYIIGLYFIPKQFAQEKAGAGAAAAAGGAEGGYVALSDTAQSPSTRLLFDSNLDDDNNGNGDPDLEDSRRALRR